MDPMKDPTVRLEALGQLVREHSDEAVDSEQVLGAARQRLGESVLERSRQGSARGRSIAWSLAFAGVLTGAFLIFGPSGVLRNEPLAVSLETEAQPIVGSWVSSGDETKQLRFSDGTSVSLHANTKLRVNETTPHGAVVVLGKGRALAQVEPKEKASWTFLAGPFSVRVIGTEFDLSWDPDLGTLELALHEGVVELRGPGLPQARRVKKGEFVKLALSSASGPAQTGDTTHGGAANDEAGSALPRHSADGALPGARPSKERSAEAPTGPKTGENASGSAERDKNQATKWQALLASSKQSEAFRELEAGERLRLEHASSKDLLSLAHAARVGGKPALARDALLAARNIHGTRGQTSYLLGKVHADQLQSPAEAIRWFETYLKEEPAGSLNEEALGRLVELQGKGKAGERAAQRYLEKYPRGSYADFARSLLR